MDSRRRSPPGLRNLALLVAVVTVLTVLWRLSGPLDRLWGDEPTYLAMATSLARDGDMRYTAADRAWIDERKPGAVILQRVEIDGEAAFGYSKPVIYPLLAAPFVRVLGEGGMLVANVVLVLLASMLAWDFLFRYGDRGAAGAAWLSFVVLSPIIVYLFWAMSESTQVALSLGGLVLTCRDLRFRPPDDGPARRVDWRGIVFGGALLGLLIALRLPNVVVAMAPVAAWALHRRPRVCLALLASIAVSFALATAVTAGLTGSTNPYRAVRTSFDEGTGYPSGLPVAADESIAPDEDRPRPATGEDRFDTAPATHRAYWRLIPEWNRSVYSALYAFAGRHTGLLVYFPAVWILAAGWRRPDRLSTCLLLAAAGLLVFYVLWLPGNYFGGSTFVGNRYWLAAYPALLVALARLPSRRAFIAGSVLGAVVGVSAAIGVLEARDAGRVDSQSHAHRGIFAWLPAESSAAAIDGWISRRWSGEVFRFVDPYAEIEDRGFKLVAGQRPAEVLLSRAPGVDRSLLFAVRADAAGSLRITDRGGSTVERLEAGRAALVSHHAARPWRLHPTTPGPAMEIHALELSFEGDDGRVEIRHLGTGPDRETAHRVRRVTLPESGFAGSTAEAWIGVRNHSSWTWSSSGVLPVHLRYRLHGDGGETVVEGPALPLPVPVEPGGTLRMPFQIRWPETPGRYELTVDLDEDLFGPFAGRVGEPLARRRVDIGPREAGAIAGPPS